LFNGDGFIDHAQNPARLHHLRIWAALGNHDVYSDPDHIEATLAVQGSNLRNRAVPIRRDGQNSGWPV
jgi:hypothetical protein